MARTKRGAKPLGYDYWGKRALSGLCGFGKKVKKLTHKIERAQAKRLVEKLKKEDGSDG